MRRKPDPRFWNSGNAAFIREARRGLLSLRRATVPEGRLEPLPVCSLRHSPTQHGGRRGVGLPKCRGDILMCYPHPQTHNILLQKQKAECQQPHSERGTPRGSVPGTPGGSVPSGLGVVRTPFPLPVTLFHAYFCRHPSWRTAAVLLLACPPCRAQGCLLVNIYCPNLCTQYPAVDAQYQL